MYTQVNKSKENSSPATRQESRAVANSVGQKKSEGKLGGRFMDNRTETTALNSSLKHANGQIAQCKCAMCNSKIHTLQKPENTHGIELSKPSSSRAIQRAITANNAAGAGNDTTINSYLANFSGNTSGSQNIWDNSLKKTNMGTRSDLNNASNNTAMSVAVNTGRTEFRTEGSYDFKNAVKGTSNEDVDRDGNRAGGEHSEIYLYNNGHTTGSIACAIDNCFFCNNFLEWKGLQHDQMKQTRVFPEMWEPPGGAWRIVKEKANTHEMDQNIDGKKWTIDNPRGGANGVYFNSQHEA